MDCVTMFVRANFIKVASDREEVILPSPDNFSLPTMAFTHLAFNCFQGTEDPYWITAPQRSRENKEKKLLTCSSSKDT